VATGIDPYIAEVMAAGPAYSAGMQSGDVVTEINGREMLDGTMETLLDTIGGWQEGDEPLRMTIRRGEETVETEITPVWDEAEGKMRIGVRIGGVYRTETQPVTLWGGITHSWEWCVRASGAILGALRDLVTKGEGLDQTSGPVGIVSLVSAEVREGGFSAFVQLLVLISINLGLMNLLPIPGLDGSRLVFGLVEVIRRKPVPTGKGSRGASGRHGFPVRTDDFLYLQGRDETVSVTAGGAEDDENRDGGRSAAGRRPSGAGSEHDQHGYPEHGGDAASDPRAA
jgi:Predicted membrane-associated Zn-dependent proteases 1